MAKTKISEYDATAGNNTDIDSISIAEGMAPSNVNNSIRAILSHLKKMDVGTDALTSPQLSSVDINGGSIDGAVIGANSAAAITGTTITGTSLVIGDANINENDFESIDGITAGTVAASKAVIVDTNKDVTGFRNVTLTGELDAATLDVSGDIDVDGTSNLDVVDIDGAVDMASTLQVDGAITSSTGATITTADNTDTLQLISTDADANIGPNLRLYRNSSSPADSDTIGVIDFEGRNDNSQDFIAARMNVLVDDVSDGTEDATLFINTMVAGAVSSRIKMTPAETVFNDDSKDLNFRVESNGSANALFIDGGSNHVNIMTSTDLGAVLNVSGNAYIQNGDNNATLTLECTDADANVGPVLDLFRNSGSPADNDYGGIVRFLYEDDADNQFVGSQILTQLIDASDGSEDVKIIWETTTAGSSTERFTIGPTETVMNEQSIDVDFRVESNDSMKMLFVDGGNNGVLIDSSGADLRPYTTLDVVSQNNTEMMIHNDTDTAGQYAALLFKADSQNENPSTGARSRTKAGIFFVRDDPGTRGTGKLHVAIDGGNDDTNVAVGDAAISITADGEVTMPKTPAFLARPTSNQNNIATNTDVTVVLGTEVFDQNANFASNLFTAPITGRYQLSFCLNLRNVDSAADYYEVQIVTSNRNYNFIQDPDYGQDSVYFSISGSALCDMDASDTARFKIVQANGTAQTDISSESHFSGYLAC